MAATVFTGWRTVRPGKCFYCGDAESWDCDGRGNVLCDCQACIECNLKDAYGFHNPGCPALDCDTCGCSGLSHHQGSWAGCYGDAPGGCECTGFIPGMAKAA